MTPDSLPGAGHAVGAPRGFADGAAEARHGSDSSPSAPWYGPVVCPEDPGAALPGCAGCSENLLTLHGHHPSLDGLPVSSLGIASQCIRAGVAADLCAQTSDNTDEGTPPAPARGRSNRGRMSTRTTTSAGRPFVALRKMETEP